MKTISKGAAANLGYELGATYLDYYWREQHTITEEHADGTVTSYWHKQKRSTRHATRHDSRDRKIAA